VRNLSLRFDSIKLAFDHRSHAAPGARGWHGPMFSRACLRQQFLLLFPFHHFDFFSVKEWG
jgi:hypothetical protein